MNDDTISRQALIDTVDEVTWYHQNKNGEMVSGANDDEHQAWYKAEDIYKAIEALPPAQPVEDIHREREQAYYCGYEDGAKAARSAQPGWIPCSTALPEYDGEYLVTKKSFGWNCTEYIETDIARYEKKDGWHKADTVLAWCELPKPWEGGQE